MEQEDLDDLHELLAGMYEIMRRHERAILELITEVEAPRSTLTPDQVVRFLKLRTRLQDEREDRELAQLGVFDEMILRLRSM